MQSLQEILEHWQIRRGNRQTRAQAAALPGVDGFPQFKFQHQLRVYKLCQSVGVEMHSINILFSISLLSVMLGGCVATTGGIVVPSTNYYDKKVVDLQPEVFQIDERERPTVMVLHGSGGVDEHHRSWAKLINSWGYNAVVFDAFKPRGIREVNGKSFDVPFLQRALDSEMVARWVKSQAWSNGKLCVIGFSHGGISVLAVDMDGYLKREIGSNHSFSCGVNYYGLPISDMFFWNTTIPIQIHVGSNDGGNDLSANRDFAKRYAANTELFVYQGADHGFDRVATDITVRGTVGLSAGGSYKIKSDPAARELSVQRVKAFFDKHLGQ